MSQQKNENCHQILHPLDSCLTITFLSRQLMQLIRLNQVNRSHQGEEVTLEPFNRKINGRVFSRKIEVDTKKLFCRKKTFAEQQT